MGLVQINWRPGKRELRSFGWGLTVGLSVVGLLVAFPPPIAWWKGSLASAALLWIVAFAVGVPAVLGSKLSLPFYYLWMGISWLIGNTVSRLILALLFYCLVTPIGIFQRIVGKDRLLLKRPPQGKSLWQDVTGEIKYERQF